MAGAYVIDAGVVTPPATIQTIEQGVKPYGLIYALLEAKIPVSWVINDDKPSPGANVSPGGIDQALGNVGTDFSFDCDAAGTKYTTRDIKTGAYIIPKEFVAQAKPVIDAFRALNDGFPEPGTITGVAQVAGQILGYDPTPGQPQGCTVPLDNLEVFATLTGWSRTALDAQNGSIAVGFYENAGIPQGPLNDPANPPAYRFATPSSLTPCDDFYVMPHADPKYSTHSALKGFAEQGGYIWAGCHAVSVLENVRVGDVATNPLALNFLSTDGLLPFGSHSGGSVPYSFFPLATDTKPYYSPTFGAFDLEPIESGDPIAQFRGRTDLAQQNGSEQIYMPGFGGTPTRTLAQWQADRSAGSKWRPETQLVLYDATQADVYPLTTTALPVKSLGPATSVVYGPAFGDYDNGLVMYEGGHSIDKGTADDAAAQRAFFNLQMLNAANRAPKVTVTAPAAGTTIASGDTIPVSGSVTGGSGIYTYTWEASCSNATTGAPVDPDGTFADPTLPDTTFTAPAVSGGVNCNLTLSVVDSCGRTGFSSNVVAVVPETDVAITKTGPANVGAGSTVSYTLQVKNNGSSPGTADGTAATDVTVTDSVPAGTTFVSTTPGSPTCTFADPVITCTLGTLADEATTSITVTLEMDSPGGFTVVNTADVTSTTFDPNLANNTDSATTLVLNSGITIEKTARPEIVPAAGGPVTFEFVVRNTGDNALSDVVVTDNPGCVISGPTGDLNGDGKLDPPYLGVDREVWRYTCTRTVTTATPDVAVSSPNGIVTGVPPIDGSIFTKQDVVQVVAKDSSDFAVGGVAWTTVTISNPAIAVTKVLDPAGQQPAPGGVATFKVTVTNTGSVPLQELDTTDIWPGTCDTAVLPATLNVGASVELSCTATLPANVVGASDNFDVPATPGATSYAGRHRLARPLDGGRGDHEPDGQ